MGSLSVPLRRCSVTDNIPSGQQILIQRQKVDCVAYYILERVDHCVVTIHLPKDGEPVCSTASLLRYGRYSQWSVDPHLKTKGELILISNFVYTYIQLHHIFNIYKNRN